MAEDHILGRRSRQRLEQAHPDLAAVVALALLYSDVDFAVLETVRTPRRQRHLVRTGKSTTKNSRHLARAPKASPSIGLVSHAADLGAWVDDAINWDWSYYFLIGDAMKRAAEAIGVRIKWGGCWDYLDHYDNAEQAYHAYIDRKKAEGGTPFADGGHFELCWQDYPV